MPLRRVPPERRKRTEISCDRCKTRKQKCLRPPVGASGSTAAGDSSGSPPASTSLAACRYCETHGLECTVTQVRKPRLYRVASVAASSPDGTSSAPSHLATIGEQERGAVEWAFDATAQDPKRRTYPGTPTPRESAPRQPVDPVPTLKDQQGQIQYIGPGSSYLYQIKIRTFLFAQGARASSNPNNDGQFLLFGRNPSENLCPPVTAAEVTASPVATPSQGACSESLSPRVVPESTTSLSSACSARGGSAHAETAPKSPNPPSTSGTVPPPRSTHVQQHVPDHVQHLSRGAVAPSGAPDTDSILPPSATAASVIDTLVTVYFDDVHPDFPVLHEATFREEYERFYAAPPNTVAADPTWICILYSVLILARRKVRPDLLLSGHSESEQGHDNTSSLSATDILAGGKVGQEVENAWWRKVQALLPAVLFTSSVPALQALMLASLHLHSTLHRDGCWTLTGAAVRIAFAIGLHREDGQQQALHSHHAMPGGGGRPRPQPPRYTPLARELRKRLWWTLRSWELMLASSLDRPSAVDPTVCSTGLPNEAILCGGDHVVMAWGNRLVDLLSQTAKVVSALGLVPSSSSAGGSSIGGEGGVVSPDCPAAPLLAELADWKRELPPHLRMEAVDGLPPGWQRPVLLMHIQYFHIISVLSRDALLALVSRRFDGGAESEQDPHHQSTSPLLEDVPDRRPRLSNLCIDAGRNSAQLLIKLDALGRFDPVLWFDMYHLYSTSLILVVSIISGLTDPAAPATTPPSSSSSSSFPVSVPTLLDLLGTCAKVSLRHRENPMIPGTNARFSVVVTDMYSMACHFVDRRKNEDRNRRGSISPAGTRVGEQLKRVTQGPGRPSQPVKKTFAAAARGDVGVFGTQHGRESALLGDISASRPPASRLAVADPEPQGSWFSTYDPTLGHHQNQGLQLGPGSDVLPAESRSHFFSDLAWIGQEPSPPSMPQPPSTFTLHTMGGGGGPGSWSLGLGPGFGEGPWTWEEGHLGDIASFLTNSPGFGMPGD
ncbi:hypothetical protein VTK73DRAFT_9600 [Phialemonium thermophilum]|uniref:Xylanolytic transcriptional activator regulatory domain-containing protein n=1 Tax=Phialemonium thermophilum TaxID=223376 RepID=A0ABR3W1M1_9PEZI